MSVQFESSDRFFRPADVESIRRNYRGMQLQSFFRAVRNFIIVVALVIGAIVAYRHTQSDARFAIKRVEVTGAVHTQRAAIDALTRQYAGLNLFRLDIDRVRRDLASLDWVSRIEIEKALPDTLRIRIVERTPAALISRNGVIRYVDENGAAFADLSPVIGDTDLPLITASSGDDVVRGVDLIRRLHTTDPAVYARISEVRPLLPHGFALFDRELGAFVYADGGDLSAKWRDLYAIADAEKLRRGDIQYADLRFNGRIVLKPMRAAIVTPATAVPQTVPTQITN